MSFVTIALIIVVLMILSIFFKVWIGVAMSVFGLIGIYLVSGGKGALMVAGMEPFTQVSAYSFTCIPMFVLMGGIVSNTGLGSDMFDFIAKLIGHVKGGMALASIVACGIFSACSGSCVATAATMGRLAYPEMKRYGYDTRLATAALACGGTLGFMIPPSIPFILYGMLTGVSIGSLFMAGILPGVVNIICYVIATRITCGINPELGPAGPRYSNRERFKSAKGTWPIILIMVIVLGGIYAGICTSTEAGAIGAAGAMIIAFCLRKLNWNTLKNSVLQAVSTTGMFIVMMVGSFIFMRFVTLSGLPELVRTYVDSLDVSRYAIVVVIIVFYLVAGAVFDEFATVMLTISITFPLMVSLGFDPIWFGVLVVKLIMMGQYIPPIGMTVFVVGGILNVKAAVIYKGVMPYFIADVAQLILLVMLPQYPLLLVR
jgi:tripartite ATP-independent transporter DctM subunit